MNASLPPLTEQQFQGQVIDLARTLGWKVAHFRPAQTARGWRTPVAADGAGFPDLILVRDRVIAAELKTQTGRVKDHQADWLQAFTAAGAEAYLWRPNDVETIIETLRRRTA